MPRTFVAICLLPVITSSLSAQTADVISEMSRLSSPRGFGNVSTPATRAAAADLILIGTVTGFEKEEIETTLTAKSKEPMSYRVAVVKITDGLTDTGGQTHVKVGIIPSSIRRLKEDSTAAFYLTKHHSGAFYVYAGGSGPLDVSVKAYAADIANVKKAAGVLSDPAKALKAADAKDRYFAAAVLVVNYRRGITAGTGKREAIPAEEGKLILQAIADADWTDTDTDKDVPPPLQTFLRLSLSEKDKWAPAERPADATSEAYLKGEYLKWHAAHGKDFRLTKQVRAGE